MDDWKNKDELFRAGMLNELAGILELIKSYSIISLFRIGVFLIQARYQTTN